VVVDCARDQLLAGTAFAGDHYRHVTGGKAADLVEHLAHGRAIANHEDSL
jgi:hypothetical protein